MGGRVFASVTLNFRVSKIPKKIVKLKCILRKKKNKDPTRTAATTASNQA